MTSTTATASHDASRSRAPKKGTRLSPWVNHLAIHGVVRPTGRVCSFAEGLMFGSAPPEHPPVFLIGLPRSGTTLAYQALVHRYHFAYPTNPTNTFVFAPTTVTWLSLKLGRSDVSSFQSNYGTSAGMAAPAESYMWYQWFDNNRHETIDDLSPWSRREVVRAVGRIERLLGAPFLNKHIKNLLRLPALAELFPRAVFVFVCRNPLDVAISLLRGRKEMTGSFDNWMSVRPRDYEEIKSLPPDQQVSRQIAAMIRDFCDDVAAIDPQRFSVLWYEGLVRDPGAAIGELANFLGERGVPLKERFDLPETFSRPKRRDRVIDDETGAKLATHIADLFGEPARVEFPCLEIGGNP